MPEFKLGIPEPFKTVGRLLGSFVAFCNVEVTLSASEHYHPIDQEVPEDEWPLLESDGIELTTNVTDIWEAYRIQGRAIMDHAHHPDSPDAA